MCHSELTHQDLDECHSRIREKMLRSHTKAIMKELWPSWEVMIECDVGGWNE